jgi:isoquinoline 1-oxidoreductase alpha subunit
MKDRKAPARAHTRIRPAGPAHVFTELGAAPANAQNRIWVQEAAVAFQITVNERPMRADVDGDTPLLWVLRDTLGIVGPKYGCGVGACGACTVHIDAQPVRSCAVPIQAVGTAKVTTIEGVGASALGKRVQAAWSELDVAQCGYCQAGQIMSATALLAANPRPSDADIDAAMSGNLCRCFTYLRIRAAIKRAAGLPAEA